MCHNGGGVWWWSVRNSGDMWWGFDWLGLWMVVVTVLDLLGVGAGFTALHMKVVKVVSWGVKRGAVLLRLLSALDLVLVAEGGAELGQKLLGWQSKMKAGSDRLEVDIAGTDVVAGVGASQLGSLAPVLVV